MRLSFTVFKSVYRKHICSDDELHGVATATIKFLEYNTVISGLSFFSFFFLIHNEQMQQVWGEGLHILAQG